MKQEKFINFLIELSNRDNEVLIESILEAYGVCFFNISINKEIKNILEVASKTNPLCEGVLDMFRGDAKKKVMMFMIPLLLAAAAHGKSLQSKEVIGAISDKVVAMSTTGDGDNHGMNNDMANDLTKEVVKKYGGQIKEKAEKGDAGTKSDVSHSTDGLVKKLVDTIKEGNSETVNKYLGHLAEKNPDLAKKLATDVAHQLKQITGNGEDHKTSTSFHSYDKVQLEKMSPDDLKELSKKGDISVSKDMQMAIDKVHATHGQNVNANVIENNGLYYGFVAK
jgi:hypothetical protein